MTVLHLRSSPWATFDSTEEDVSVAAVSVHLGVSSLVHEVGEVSANTDVHGVSHLLRQRPEFVGVFVHSLQVELRAPRSRQLFIQLTGRHCYNTLVFGPTKEKLISASEESLIKWLEPTWPGVRAGTWTSLPPPRLMLSISLILSSHHFHLLLHTNSTPVFFLIKIDN